MKKLLNTLYLTQPDYYVHKERETIVISANNAKVAQFPALSIQSILCFGRIPMSPELMAYCTDNGISIAFYTEYGRFQARIQGRTTGNILLRREQFRLADDPERALTLVRIVVAAKIANSRAILQREIRNSGANAKIINAIESLSTSLDRCRKANSYDEFLGVEGEAASHYFEVFNELIKVPGFVLNGRIRRPPTDEVNALLSFTYSLITQECVSALYGVGLDPFVGFLHKDRPGRPSLALDLIEEFRSFWADRFVLSLLNLKQLKRNDFIKEACGGVRLTDEARKKFLVAYQERKKEEIMHPYLNEKVELGLIPHCQAFLLARHIRGDMQFYTPFLVK